jgi:hypothetical protein
MRTMSRKYPFPAPRGERRYVCDYCGMTWYMSQLRRDAAGFYACPDDQSGRDTVTLNRQNAAGRVEGGVPIAGTVRVTS